MKEKMILIIDDETDLVGILSLNLMQAGYKVLSAYDGEVGLELAKKNLPDLILLDINMPKKGGLDFYREILTKNNKPLFPVLVMTARGELKGIFESVNATGFISKPFSIQALLKEVDRFLNQKNSSTNGNVVSDSEKPKRVLLIEDDVTVFNKIAMELLDAGYIVNAARRGLAGLERALLDVPDLALIKLGLPDLAGDDLALKLHQLTNTKCVPVLLYHAENTSLDENILKKICEKAGIKNAIPTNDPKVLIVSVRSIFNP